MTTPFNKPYITGRETEYIAQCVSLGQLSANGHFTQLCNRYFEQEYSFSRALLTTSCTAALEMAALLCNIQQGDEVIVPSFTFVSTALAFAKQGATIRFVDSLPHHPNMDCSLIEPLITPQTKAIVAVHYNGVECDMDAVCSLAEKYGLMVIEDAAHAIGVEACGKRGDLVCYSFHETKNIHCGEGGLLGINNPAMVARAERLWLKGTNRLAFEQGTVGKYEWVETGGSFAPSEMTAAFLWAQLEQVERICQRRTEQWQQYQSALSNIPTIKEMLIGSAHIFYLLLPCIEERNRFIAAMQVQGIMTPFHYQALHRSPYGSRYQTGQPPMPNAERFSECLVRLPLFYELTNEQIDTIAELTKGIIV